MAVMFGIDFWYIVSELHYRHHVIPVTDMAFLSWSAISSASLWHGSDHVECRLPCFLSCHPPLSPPTHWHVQRSRVQSIFGFNGANAAAFGTFRTTFPNHTEVWISAK